MNLKSASQIRNVIHNILKKCEKLSEFQNAEDFHLRLENEPFMPWSSRSTGIVSASLITTPKMAI